MDGLARELDLDDFWDRWMFFVLGVALGYVKPDFWRDSNPIEFIVIPIWHYREIWRIWRRQRNETSTRVPY